MSRMSLSQVTCITSMLAIAVATVSQAEELRCTQLGANCVCSEPFQMTSFTHQGDAAFWNPADSITKQCGVEAAGAPISRNVQDVIGSTDATALARLPAGNSVARFVSSTGTSSTFFLGANKTVADLGSTFNKRMAIRGYVYHSPSYNFRDETPPCHSKLLQGMVGSWHWENFTGPIHMYDFFGSNFGPSGIFPRDCCFNNPGPAYVMKKSDWKGHWFRIEVVVTNRAGGPSPNGVRYILYMQDVTNGVTKVNGGNEFVGGDWGAVDRGGPATWDGWDNITSNPRQTGVAFNFYREVSAGGGQCNGMRGLSHMMVAGWDTDQGQRIGPALEVEGLSGAPIGGGGPPPVKPLPPTLH